MSDSWDDIWEEEQEKEEKEVAPRPIRRRRPARNERRGNLYLLTGMVMGVVIGLAYAWLISPVEYIDTTPQSLAEPYKDEYRRLIALAYAADRNLGRARERLALLDSEGSVQILASQAQRMLAENQPPQEARALAVLAADLGKPDNAVIATAAGTASPQAISEGGATETPGAPTAVEVTSATEISSAIQTPTLPLPTRTPTVTLTPMPTFTPRPTATPLPVLDAPFKLVSKKEICDGSVAPGLLQVIVVDAEENQMPGVRIIATWIDGQETFFTGLNPASGLGYADFLMTTGVTYGIKVGDVSDRVDGIQSKDNCGMNLLFIQQSGG